MRLSKTLLLVLGMSMLVLGALARGNSNFKGMRSPFGNGGKFGDRNNNYYGGQDNHNHGNNNYYGGQDNYHHDNDNCNQFGTNNDCNDYHGNQDCNQFDEPVKTFKGCLDASASLNIDPHSDNNDCDSHDDCNNYDRDCDAPKSVQYNARLKAAACGVIHGFGH